jgi:hypothetical protein
MKVEHPTTPCSMLCSYFTSCRKGTDTGRAEGADEAEEIVNTLRRDDEYIPIERWDERHALMLAETFPKYLLDARTACDPCMLAFAVEAACRKLAYLAMAS